MFWQKKNKEEMRYYLLPGMGRSNRRRHQQIFRWALVVGVLISIAFGTLIYFLNKRY